MAEFERLFAQGRLGRLATRNRIVMPAMGTGMAGRGGFVTDQLLKYYARRAAGGVAVVVTEVTNVHQTGAVPGVMDIYDDQFVEGQARLAGTIKAGGARAFCQLYHPGRQTSSRVTGHPLVAPSAVPARPANETPPAASLDTIEELIGSYVEGAVRASRAGFDGVELHGAHGYLIAAFLSAASNRREDDYGGDIARRGRFATEIIRRTRVRLGVEWPITFRISAEDGLPGGMTLEDTIIVARMLEQAGVDAISVSAGCYDAFERTVPPMWMPQAGNAPLAAAVRNAVNVPIIVAGRINDPAVAEQVLADGAADFVAIGRGLLADPDLPRKAESGTVDEIRHCVGCNSCIDRIFGGKSMACMVNPELGREGDFTIANVTTPKRVIVVGGGPVGMEAATILASRGHEVELYEREAQLGGKLPLCGTPEWKRGFDALKRELAARVMKSAAKIRLGQTLTAEEIAERRPAAVVLACGAEAMSPELPGLPSEKAFLAEEVLRDARRVGPRVVVVGGSYTACEVALLLANRGHEVTIVRRGARVGTELGRMERWWLLPQLEAKGVRMLAGVTYDGIIEGGMAVSKDGVRQVLPADSIVLATGYAPRRELADALNGVVPEVYSIGDCDTPGNLMKAIHEASQVAAAL